MNFIKHPSNNFTYLSPADMVDRCGDLPVIKSYWKPNEQDIANILAGGHVCLYIVGDGMPPVAITVEP